MVSFLKEDGNDLPEPNQEQIDHQQDYLTVTGYNEKLKQSTMILALLFAVGGALVWFMVKKVTPAQAAAGENTQQLQIEHVYAQLENMKTEVTDQMDSVVGQFYQQDNIGQIKVSELKKNPFKRELAVNPIEEKRVEEDTTVKLRKQLQKQAQIAQASLQLWSITSSPRGMCCMINDKVLYKGDTVNGCTINHITSTTVTLAYQDIEFSLKME